MDFSAFEKRIGVTFSDKQILKQAFVHRSYINENKNFKLPHNERLEFLGDAVLELVVTDHLFRAYPDKHEGELTSYRAALVNAVTLSQVANSLGMSDYLLLSHGEAKDTGRARSSIMADAFEAITGAIYVDQGYDAAKGFIAMSIFPLIEAILKEGSWIDAKSRFQEEAQEKTGITPSYKTTKEAGPDHDKRFTVGVYLDTVLIVEGDGKSKQEAEQEAASKALALKGWSKEGEEK